MSAVWKFPYPTAWTSLVHRPLVSAAICTVRGEASDAAFRAGFLVEPDLPITTVPMDYIEAIGLSWESGKPVRKIDRETGRSVVSEHRREFAIRLSFSPDTHKYPEHWFVARVHGVKGPSKYAFGRLGRRDTLDRFDPQVDNKKHAVIITASDEEIARFGNFVLPAPRRPCQ